MKKTIISIALLSLTLVSSSCAGKKEEISEEGTVKTDSTQTATTETTTATGGELLKDPFKDFPKEAISIAAGGEAFVAPDLANPGNKGIKAEDLRLIFVNKKVKEAGAEYSKVTSFGAEVELPNYLIIPIKPGQTAKKGDIVLAPWHHGSSMMRAIVIDAKDATKPKVNFIDVDWENPAKGDKGVGYGQEETQLEPNTFHVLSAAWESGTTVAVKKGNEWREFSVVKVSGEKVMIFDAMHKIKVVSKADCKAIEVKPTCKVGDEVMAPWVGKFVKTKVQKIDTKYGRVYVKDPYSDKPLIVPFGAVTTSL